MTPARRRLGWLIVGLTFALVWSVLYALSGDAERGRVERVVQEKED